MQDPTRQYNGDETGFQLDPRNGKVLAPRNVNVYSEAGGTKEQLTVLITTRADGKVMPPAIVYPYKRAVPKDIVDKVPEDFLVARSDSGWMTSEIFFEYMANCFIPRLNALRREEKNLHPSADLALSNDDWIVYWIDGYSSHLTLYVSQLCELNKVHLYCFKAHASHICQPNDVGPFKPLKQEWRLAVAEWRQSHPYQALTRQQFAPLLASTIEKLNSQAVVAGYKATGLYPWNADAVHYDNLTTRRRHPEEPQPENSASDIQQIHIAECRKPVPQLLIEPGPFTDGYSIAYRYDESNNIVITSIVYNVNSAVGFSACADEATAADVSSLLSEVFPAEDPVSTQNEHSELTELLNEVWSACHPVTETSSLADVIHELQQQSTGKKEWRCDGVFTTPHNT